MPRLTLRTLFAYIDDTLEPDQARALGKKVSESDEAKKLIERIKRVTRRRGLTNPVPTGDDDHVSDPNTVAEYLSDSLPGPQVRELEETCLESDVHLAEVAACHQILTLVLTEPVRVPPSANQRMYQLVGPPASDPRRKPGKTIPVGGVAPDPDRPDADDPDAALLLGMQRYAASESWGGRLRFVVAVAGVAASLAFAVFMALPPGPPQAPEQATEVAARPPGSPTPVGGGTLGTGPAGVIVPVPGPSVPAAIPDPKPVEPKKKPETVEPTPVEPKKVEPKKVEPKKVEPDPKVGPKPEDLDPLPGQEVVGKMESLNTIVMTRSPEAGARWGRLDPRLRNVVRANDAVLALPGYKADVKLESGVTVHLWGNVPEQVSMKSMVMQSRVRFHPTTSGLDGDLTLDAGRIYLTAAKAGSRVRVRVGTEVWDVTLGDEKSDVLIQANIAFVPGTTYSREGGAAARTEARLVVLRGTADVNLKKRFKTFNDLAAGTELIWDSKAGTVTDPHPAPKDELFADRIPLPEAERGRVLQRVFSETEKDFTNATTIRVLLGQRITADHTADLSKPGLTRGNVFQILFPTQWAIYSQAAIADGPDAPALLEDLVDQLASTDRLYARQTAVVALSGWVGLRPGNTEALVNAMISKNRLPEDADLIASLLRGHSSADMKAPDKLNELVGYLDHPNLAVRETALGNLLAYYSGPDTFATKILVETNVANREENRAGADPARLKAWEAFLNAWKTHADAIKKRMAEPVKM